MTRCIGLVVLLALTVTPVVAICPYPAPKVCSAFFESDVVFVGKVLSKRYTDNDDYIRFDVRVAKRLKGTVSDTAHVYTGNDSGRLSWDVGRDYVVFARREHERLVSGDDCSALSDPTKVSETIRQIDDLGRATTATIEGEVVSRQPDGPGVRGILVRARGERQTYVGTSDSRGVFRIEVPAGRYQVLSDPNVKQSDYSGSKLADINLVTGQCAQVQFVTR